MKRTSNAITIAGFAQDTSSRRRQGRPDKVKLFVVYLTERNLYGSSRLGAEYLENAEMEHEPLVEYMPLNPIETISVGELCTTTGGWYYEVPNTSAALLDLNVDGYDDIRFTCTNTDLVTYGTGFSMQVGLDVVPGETYTLDFDYLDETNLDFFAVEARDCSVGTVLLNDMVTIGHVAKTFTVPAGCSKVRIKWLAERDNPAFPGDVTISKIVVQGAGTEFEAFEPDTAQAVQHKLGQKRYELSNHLGNVLSVISDRKLTENVDTLVYSNDFSSTLGGFVANGTITQSLTGNRLYAANASLSDRVRRTVTTVAGRRYRASCSLDVGTGGTLAFFARDNATNANIVVVTTTSTDNLSFEFTALSAATHIMVQNNFNGTRDFYVDNVVLEDITAAGYTADILQSQDYSPFGVILDGRNFTVGDDYRYSFQGQEHDDEIKGAGNSINFEYRMHDPRVGRFFAVDPLAPVYPFYSPYAFSGNRLIDMVELEGLEPGTSTYKKGCGNPIAHSRGLTSHDCHLMKKASMEEIVGQQLIFVGMMTGIFAIAEATMAGIATYIIEEMAEELAGFPIFPDPVDAVQHAVRKSVDAPHPLKVLPGDNPTTILNKRKELATQKMGSASKTDYIDFNKPVYTATIEKDIVIYQYRRPGDSNGNYFVFSTETTPEQVGLVSSEYTEVYKVTLKTNSKVLVSTHTKNATYFRDKSKTVEGGGKQIYSESISDETATFEKITP